MFNAKSYVLNNTIRTDVIYETWKIKGLIYL
jgi:hypothetical protein